MKLELPVIPKSGEVFLAVDSSTVESHTVAETLKLLEDMDYTPQSRYRQARDSYISLYGLLYRLVDFHLRKSQWLPREESDGLVFERRSQFCGDFPPFTKLKG